MKPAVTWIPAHPNNYAASRSAPISQITFHHIVGDAPAAIARFQNGTQEVSASYVIGSDGRIYQIVKDTDTPYTDANYDSNSRSITIEHAGGIAGVPYTEAMYQSSIALVRWLIATYGITNFKRHREVSRTPTACPGELNVERIINEAKGGVMDTGITLGTARILADGVLGRDGYDGRTNAHAGGADPDLTSNHVNKPLTNAYINGLFTSAEATNFRKARAAVYAERNVLRSEVSANKLKISELTSIVSIKDNEIVRLTKENETLRAQVGDNTKWNTLKALIRELIS